MKLIWAGPARRDLLELTAFYRRIDPSLSIRMRLNIEAAARKLLSMPGVGTMVGTRGSRRWQVKGTPYALFFRVGDNRLEIEAVVHGSRNYKPE